MTVLKLLSPEQNRARYSAMRARGFTADPEPPKLHDDNKLLDDEVDDEKNQLPLKYQGALLKVLLPRFAAADDPTVTPGKLQLRLNGTLVGSKVDYETPVDPATTEFELTLPSGWLATAGAHELSCAISHGGNPAESQKLTFFVDNKAPLPNGRPKVPAEVENEGITKAYMDANGFVLVTLEDWLEKRIGDTVECRFGTSLPVSTLVGTKTLVEADLTLPVEFQLTSEIIGPEEVRKSLFYYLVDRKGNKSTQSEFTELDVSWTTPPDALVDPSVPLFDGDTGTKMIDLADAQTLTGVGVGIEVEYLNYEKGSDFLITTFDGIRLPDKLISAFPIYGDAPYSAVYNGNLGSKTVPVSYQIRRNGKFYPSTPLTKNVLVDLRRPGDGEGGENPHPTLALATVKGAVTAGNNILRKEDENQPVKVSVPVFTDAKDKDVVTLIWKDVELTDDQGGVLELDGTETGDLVFDVEWSVVSGAGNARVLPVTYKITNPDVNHNAVYSRAQNVDVLIRPGVVPELKIQHLDPDFTNWLNCNSLQPDTLLIKCVEVTVAAGELQLADQELEFNYTGYSDATGATPIPGVVETVKFKPTVQQATDGFVVKFPYKQFLDTGSAWGACKYTAIIDGHPTESNQHLVRVHMKLADGSLCKI